MTSFQPFGADHQVVLGLVSGAGLALLVGARWMRRVKEGDRLIRYLLALILVGVGFGSWVCDATTGNDGPVDLSLKQKSFSGKLFM